MLGCRTFPEVLDARDRHLGAFQSISHVAHQPGSLQCCLPGWRCAGRRGQVRVCGCGQMSIGGCGHKYTFLVLAFLLLS